MKNLKYIMVVLSDRNLVDGKYIEDEGDLDICILATHIPTIEETQRFLEDNDFMCNRLYVVAIEELDEDWALESFNIGRVANPLVLE